MAPIKGAARAKSRKTIAESTTTGDQAVGVNRTRWKNAVYLSKQFGGVVRFGEVAGVGKQQASHMWGARPVRNIGTRNARRIEIAAGVPAGWLDVEHELDKPSMSTTGVTAFDSRNAFESKAPRAGVLQLRPVEQIADWVTHQIPSVASHSVQLIQDAGSAMATSIPLNSMAVLNTAINSIVDDGIYLLEFSGIRVLRRVALQLDGSLVLTSEARGADPMHVDQGQKQSVHVIGKVVAIISVDPA